MRILVLNSEIPFPPITGAQSRTYHLLRRLSAEHGVTLVGFMVLAMSSVPIKDSVRAADPWHAMRVLDGALHILVAWLDHLLVDRPTKIGIGEGELGCPVAAQA